MHLEAQTMKNPVHLGGKRGSDSVNPQSTGSKPMNMLTQPTQHAQTMSSIDLLKMINQVRTQFGEKEVRTNDFAKRIEDELEGENYETFVVQNSNKTTSTAFLLNKDQCTLVAMRESKGVRRTVLEKLKELEAQAKSFDPMTALSDPATMRHLLLGYTEKVIELEHQVSEMQTDVAAYNLIAKADGSLCLTDAAKTLQMRPKEFIALLNAQRWIYKRAGSAHYVGYQDKIQSGYLEHKVTEVSRGDGTSKITEQVRVTPKGLAKLSQVTVGVLLA